MLITALIFIAVLAVLVLVHEFGHFIVAKKSGMKVEEFGFGFPPRLIGVKKTSSGWKVVFGHSKELPIEGGDQTGQAPDSTLYSINLIPLGGFVKIMGENNEQENDPRSFINRPFWGRFFTLVAGVTMNVILAWVLTSGGYIAGLPVALDNPEDLPKNAQFINKQVAIIEVVKDFPAEKAGIKPTDIVLKIDGQDVTILQDLQSYIRENAGKELVFTIKRGESTQDIKVQSQVPTEDQGPTGIALAYMGKLKYPVFTAFAEGAKTTVFQLKSIVVGLYEFFANKPSLDNLGGPVRIAKLTGEVADLGWVYLLQFTSFLSLNLAILNILPFPALDGGRVLFLIVEKIRGKRNNQKIEQWANAAGFALLLLLMLLVTIKDVKGII
jgi:regulator of sigma E protease